MYWLAKFAKQKFILGLAIAALFGMVLAPAAFAQGDDPEGGDDAADSGDTFGLNEVNTGLSVDGKNALGNKDLRTTIGDLIRVALSLLGVVAVVIILIGGFKWMTAGGNEEKVTEARKLIFSGIIGLAIILSAWAIAIFVIEQLSSATGSGDVPTFSS